MNEYTSCSNSEKKPLNFEELSKFVKSFKPITVGFTFNSEAWEEFKEKENIQESKEPLTAVHALAGIPIFIVPNQKEKVIEWKNKNAMNLFIAGYAKLAEFENTKKETENGEPEKQHT